MNQYRSWGDVTTVTFEAWWKAHRELFIEASSVEELTHAEFTRKPNHLYLAINLTKPPSKLIPQITERITRLQTKQALLRDGHKRKSKRVAECRYNEATEIHLPTFREQYRFFKYVYIPELYPASLDQLKDSLGAGKKLWNAAVKHYKSKKKPKYLRLSATPTPTTLRNLRRYVQRLDLLVARVAAGQFP